MSRAEGKRALIRNDLGTEIWTTMRPGAVIEVLYNGVSLTAERHIITPPCGSRIAISYKLSHYRKAHGVIGKAHAIGIDAPLDFEIIREELL